MAEQNSQRPEKPFFLHQEIDFPTFGARIELTQHEVPIARVGGQTDDVFFGMVDSNVLMPSQMLVQKPIAKLLPHGRRKETIR